MQRPVQADPPSVKGQGSILIVSLWTLLVLAVLALAVGARVASNLQMATYLKQRQETYELARAGVETAIAWLGAADTNSQIRQPESANGAFNCFDTVPLGRGTFSVVHIEAGRESAVVTNFGVTGTDSRINLNFCTNIVGREMFRALLETTGKLARSDAEEIAACVADWVDADDTPLEGGAENDYYQGRPVPYECHNGPMNDISEVLLVKGVTTGIVARVEHCITVEGTDGRVNINTAGYPVLVAMAAARKDADILLCESLAERILKFREDGDIISGVTKKEVQALLFETDKLERQAQEEWLIVEWLLNHKVISVQSRQFCGISTGILSSGSGVIGRSISFVYDSQTGDLRAWNESR